MRAHADDPHAARFGPTGFRISSGRDETDIYPTCSYCGSLEVKTVIDAMSIAGTNYSGSDWKYGLPHKFYLDIPCEPYRRLMGSGPEPGQERWGESRSRHHKFYAEHLLDATFDEIDQWNNVVAPLVGIRYALRDDGDLRFKAPYGGFQTWGYVGGVLTPGHHEAGLDHAALAPQVPALFLASPFPPIKPEITA